MPKNAGTSVLDRARHWPEERRREAERLLEAMEEAGAEVYTLSVEERRLIDEGLQEALRGEFVPDTEMETFWSRHDR